MPRDVSAEMTEVRFAAIVAAYGADPAGWPAAERKSAELWLVSNPAARTLLSEERGLDRALGAADLPGASPALERRLLADFDDVQRSWSLRKLVEIAADAIWPGAPLWQPACALGLALAAGLGIALFAPFDLPQPDDFSSSAFALDTAPDADAGHGI